MSSKRIHSLDILRGLACSMVLIGHMPMPPQAYQDSAFWPLVHAMRKTGWMGVDLFFVLSGLLISGLLFKEIQATGKIDLKRFWLRRGFKIWPSYYIIFGVFVVAGLLHAWHKHDNATAEKIAGNIPINMVFAQNYVAGSQWPHSWSVAVEEHFYLALPLLLTALLAWRRLHWLPAITAVIWVAVLAMRFSLAVSGGEWEAIKYPTHLHVDALFCGVLLGYFVVYHPERVERLRKFWPLTLIAVAAIFGIASQIVFHFYPVPYACAFTVVFLVFAALVLMAKLHPDFGRTGPLVLRIPSRVLATIGIYSYTIYLMHGVIFTIPGIRNLLAASDWQGWRPCIFLAVSIASGMLACRWIERPFLRLRDWLIPSTSSQRSVERDPTPAILPFPNAPAEIRPAARAA